MSKIRAEASPEDLQAQFDFLVAIRDKLTETHKTIKKLRDVRTQLNGLQARLKKAEKKAENESDEKSADDQTDKPKPEPGSADDNSLAAKCQKLADELTEVEKKLYQTRNQSGQDPLNYPIQLNNRLSALVSVVSEGDNAPTKQSFEVRDELVAEIDQHLATLQELLGPRLDEINQAFRDAQIPAIFVD